MKRPFTIYDLRFTIQKKSAKPAIAARPPSAATLAAPKQSEGGRHSRSGVALIITVILLAVVTFMAITFLAVSRRERGAVTATTDTATAQLAADDALASAEAQIMANTLAATNPYNFGLLVSTNYINNLGFTPGSLSPTNVNYNYLISGGTYTLNDFLQNLANLHYLPRPPVFVTTNANGPLDFRFYLDLNRNATNDANGLVPEIGNDGFPIVNGGVTNYVNAVGDPDWIGVLQHPDQPYGPNNPFVARYAFVAVPIGNALDLNAIYNDAMGIKQKASMNGGNDGFLRNQGVGSWEINLAGFLADLNTNEWDSSLSGGAYNYQTWNGTLFNGGSAAFADALSLLSYRYDYFNNFSYNLASADRVFGVPNAGNTFPYDGIDAYSVGPVMTGFRLPADNDNTAWAWSGADNTNHFYDAQDLFNTSETAGGVPQAQIAAGNDFTGRLLNAGAGVSTYNRYTYYRLLSQMGVDSVPEQNQINLNYANAFASFDNYGVVTNITIFPGAETNLVPWTPLQFFTIAADKMMRLYSREWLEESPSNYVATYGMTTNIGTTAFPTNMPVPFGISDIPVLVSNRFVYTPAVQRVLQLAANIYDATTNNATATTPNYPSVFRPIFWVTNDAFGYNNVYIKGYQQVVSVPNGASDSQLALPVDVNALASGTYGFGIFTNNVYGVPWIIGAKKGFPNFNEFAMESAFQLTRKLQVTRPYTNAPLSLYQYKQMFNLSLSNQFGIECWNSYTNAFVRSVAIYANCTNTCVLANDEGFSTNLSFQILGFAQTNFWPGYGNVYQPNLQSFEIPLYTNFAVIPTSMYRFNTAGNVEEPGYVGPYLTTNLDYPWGNSLFESGVTWNGQSYPQPHWRLTNSDDVRVIILDTTVVPNRVIDYVQLVGPNTNVDLTSEILSRYDSPTPWEPSGTNLWSTNFLNGLPVGLDSQMGVSLGNYTAGAASGIWNQTGPTLVSDQINGFRAFFGLSALPGTTVTPTTVQIMAEDSMTNDIQVPYSPIAMIVQEVDWQVNDPLVHYLASDLNWPGADQIKLQADSLTNNGTIGQLNQQRYMPWGRFVQVPPGVDPNAYNLAFKDPLVRQSDDWDFPTYKLPTIGWLGRVHRGTPWQTVYLKSPDILHEIQTQTMDGKTVTNNPYMGTNSWVWWTGNTLIVPNQNPTNIYYFDAANMAPVQDRLLFDLFSTAPNDNATRGQLSVNVGASNPSAQAGLAAWSALLSGVQVLSNTVPDLAVDSPAFAEQHNGSVALANFTTFPINPAGPAGPNAAVGEIVTGINQTRANANTTPWVSSFQVLTGGVTNEIEIPATFANADGLGGAFEHVGDILAVPQLSVYSPFLNTDAAQQTNGISDEMYDWLPQQVMSLLRVSGTPQSPMRYVIYSYGQALKPAANGIYTGSGQYFGMATNYQVVAESATRTVVNFGSVVTNVIATNADDNWISVPVVTNNQAQIEQFNVLPPD